jgi:hypothetical protein
MPGSRIANNGFARTASSPQPPTGKKACVNSAAKRPANSSTIPGIFDHLVRSEEQFHYLRRYIARNPEKSGLRLDEVTHYTKEILKL